jgi:hypothetical protein
VNADICLLVRIDTSRHVYLGPPHSSGVRAPLLRLQVLQESMMLSISEPPPRDHGVTCSYSREFGCPDSSVSSVPQYWHRKTPSSSVAAWSACFLVSLLGVRFGFWSVLLLSSASFSSTPDCAPTPATTAPVAAPPNRRHAQAKSPNGSGPSTRTRSTHALAPAAAPAVAP